MLNFPLSQFLVCPSVTAPLIESIANINESAKFNMLILLSILVTSKLSKY